MKSYRKTHPINFFAYLILCIHDEVVVIRWITAASFVLQKMDSPCGGGLSCLFCMNLLF